MWNEGILGLLICGFITAVLMLITKRRWSRGNERFPPGPFAWPLIGHLHLFSHLPHQTLADVSKRYRHIVGLRLGQQKAVVVSSPELAKQVLLTHDKVFADRPPLALSAILFFGRSNGITFNSPGPQWRNNRKICILQLFTAKRLQEMEYVRQEEIGALLHSIHEQSGGGIRAVDLGRCAGQMSSRVILRLLGSKATIGEIFPQIIAEQEEELRPTLGDLIPCLSWLDFFRKQRMRRFHARLDKVYTEILMERKGSASHHDDLLNALLSEEEALTMVEVKGILNDIIGAGIHTTALSLEWTMAELLKNPQCLYQLRREIETQLSGKKQVSDADLPNLRYLKCVVKEAARLHPVAPLLVPHMSIEECKVQGYTIPAKTLMYVNVWAMGRDERVWPNANEFMPERFEGKDVDLKGQHFELLPFGSGRRICVGLPLALSIIEVTLANLVSCFDWELPYGEADTSINMDEKKGLTANKAFPVMAIPKPRLALPKLPNIGAYSSK